MKKINIAIIGLGNIGSYLFKYLNDNKNFLREKNNCLPVIKYETIRQSSLKFWEMISTDPVSLPIYLISDLDRRSRSLIK